MENQFEQRMGNIMEAGFMVGYTRTTSIMVQDFRYISDVDVRLGKLAVSSLAYPHGKGLLES